jgi:hypothetical protein
MSSPDEKFETISSDEKIESDENPSSTLTATPAPEITLSPLSPSRSRRPTLVENTPTTRRPSTGSVIQLARKEKWTVARVFRVTWAYVTTLKVIISQNDRH